MKKRALLIFFLVYYQCGYSQLYVHKNEVSIISFDTKNGKHLEIVRDTSNKYLNYRFGTKAKIEFEYPSRDANSWKKFKYTSELRGGGLQNEGIDLIYFYFTNDSIQYVVYDTYYAREKKSSIGIQIINLKHNNEITNIIAVNKSVKGTLTDFRDIDLIEQGDEIFD